jgi:hypothetical protein
LRVEVEAASAELDQIRPLTRTRSNRRCAAPAPQGRLDPCKELPEVDRFWQVIVGPDLQADDPVDRLAGRRHHDDDRIRALGEEPGEREPVLTRHGDVEKDEVDADAGRERTPQLGGVLETGRPVSVIGQILAERLANILVVIDDGYMRRGHLELVSAVEVLHTIFHDLSSSPA